MNLKKAFQNILIAIMPVCIITSGIFLWLQNHYRDQVWKQACNQVKERYNKVAVDLLEDAIQHYMQQSEFKSEIDPDVVATIPKEEQAEELLERLKSGERDGLLEDVAKGLHRAYVWFPKQGDLNSEQAADKAADAFIKLYTSIRSEGSNPIVLRREFDAILAANAD